MKSVLDTARAARWCMLAAVAVLPAACFLDTFGVGAGSGGGATGGTGTTTSSTSTTSDIDSGPDADANLCGNGAVDPGEECDGTHLGGATCASLGHAGGNLTCTPGCKLDTSGCTELPLDWYDKAWHHRRAVTINHAQVPGDLADFPVVLSITDAGLLGQLQANGGDVLITGADGKTKLAHEIELFDVTAGALVLWVRVPLLSASADTTLYLYYANPSSPSQQNVAGVWDAHDQVVLHLGEKATAGGTATTFLDSTGHGHAGAQQGTADGAGRVGRGQTFDGVSQYINVGNPDTVVIGTSGCTVSAWIKTSTATSAAILSKAQGELNVPNDKVLLVAATHQIGVDSYNVASNHGTIAVNDGQWHHVAWTQTMGTSSQWDIYVDGKHDGSWPVTPTSDLPGYTVRIGSRVAAAPYLVSFFAGTIDEVRVADTPRSPTWIQASVNNQSNPASFAALGAEQP